jgi:hypothetical protein
MLFTAVDTGCAYRGSERSAYHERGDLLHTQFQVTSTASHRDVEVAKGGWVEMPRLPRTDGAVRGIEVAVAVQLPRQRGKVPRSLYLFP